jgi:hypothetical protein
MIGAIWPIGVVVKLYQRAKELGALDQRMTAAVPERRRSAARLHEDLFRVSDYKNHLTQPNSTVGDFLKDAAPGKDLEALAATGHVDGPDVPEEAGDE